MHRATQVIGYEPEREGQAQRQKPDVKARGRVLFVQFRVDAVALIHPRNNTPATTAPSSSTQPMQAM